MAESEPVDEPSGDAESGNRSGPPVRRTTMRQRLALWAAAAVVALIAGALVAVAARDDDSAPPALPLAAAAEADAEAGGVAGPMAMGGVIRYVPAEDLPAMGGEGVAYRLSASTNEDDVRRLANAFGIDGDPTEREGFWHVDDNQLFLDVYGATGTWSMYRQVADDVAVDSSGASASGSGNASPSAGSSRSAGSSDSATVIEQCAMEPPPGMSSDDVAVGVACAELQPVEPGQPVRPNDPVERLDDLPDETEARDIALELLSATGAEVDGADVRVEDGITQWMVVVEPIVGGLRAPGLGMSVAVGPEGRIESASGHLGQPEELGQYPLVDIRAALGRLNGGWAVTAGPPPLPIGDPDTPVSGGREPASAAETDGGSVASHASGSATPTTTVGGPPHDLPPPPPAPGEASGSSAPATTVLVPPHDPTPPPAAGTGLDTRTGPTQTDPPVAQEPAAGVAPPATPPPDPPPSRTSPQAPPETLIPEPPATTVPPTDIIVTEAEMVYLLVPSWDGSGGYLVPGYQFVAADGTNPVVPAVSDHVIERPPDAEQPDEPDEGPAEPGGG